MLITILFFAQAGMASTSLFQCSDADSQHAKGQAFVRLEETARGYQLEITIRQPETGETTHQTKKVELVEETESANVYEGKSVRFEIAKYGTKPSNYHVGGRRHKANIVVWTPEFQLIRALTCNNLRDPQ